MMMPKYFDSIHRTITNLDDSQSNYPRDQAESWLGPELNRLEKVTKFDTAVAGAYALTVITFDVVSRLNGESTFPFLIPIAQLNGLLFLTIAIVTVWWIYLAHSILSQLRKDQSHSSSLTTAFLCMISPLVLFLPMTHTLDFLVQKSDDEESPTMQWYSIKSRSNLVTGFMILGILSMVVSLSTQTLFASPSPWRQTVSLIAGLLNVSMILVGNRIFVRITQNLVKI